MPAPASCSAARRASASAATRSSRSRAGAPVDRAERVGDGRRDVEEADPAVEERVHRDLVGGVVRARERPAALAGLARQRQQREGLESGASNARVSPAARSSGSTRRRRPLRIGERERDRHAHVRACPRCASSGAVAEAHERVDDRARVDDDVDPLVRDTEQPVRLDQLETLVRERGRVDGDLRAHAPRRMLERLAGDDRLELVAAAPAERPAGRGEDERVDGLRVAALEALVERRVLAVDRQQQPSTPLAAPRARASRRRRGSPCWRARA